MRTAHCTKKQNELIKNEKERDVQKENQCFEIDNFFIFVTFFLDILSTKNKNQFFSIWALKKASVLCACLIDLSGLLMMAYYISCFG